MKLAPSCEIFRDDVRSSSPSNLLCWTTRFDPTHCPCKMDGGLVWIWICVVDPAHSRAVRRSLAATSPSSAAPSSSAGMTRAFIVGATRRAPTRPPSIGEHRGHPSRGNSNTHPQTLLRLVVVARQRPSSHGNARRRQHDRPRRFGCHQQCPTRSVPPCAAPCPSSPSTTRARGWEIQKAMVNSTGFGEARRRGRPHAPCRPRGVAVRFILSTDSVHLHSMQDINLLRPASRTIAGSRLRQVAEDGRGGRRSRLYPMKCHQFDAHPPPYLVNDRQRGSQTLAPIFDDGV